MSSQATLIWPVSLQAGHSFGKSLLPPSRFHIFSLRLEELQRGQSIHWTAFCNIILFGKIMIAATATATTITNNMYGEVLDYLERDFLPSLDAAESSGLSIQRDPQSLAVVGTPLRNDTVGLIGLASPSAAVSPDIESSLKKLAATIVPLFEAALRGQNVDSFDVDTQTGVALLNVLHQCLEKIISFTCSRKMVSICFYNVEKPLVTFALIQYFDF